MRFYLLTTFFLFLLSCAGPKIAEKESAPAIKAEIVTPVLEADPTFGIQGVGLVRDNRVLLVELEKSVPLISPEISWPYKEKNEKFTQIFGHAAIAPEDVPENYRRFAGLNVWALAPSRNRRECNLGRFGIYFHGTLGTPAEKKEDIKIDTRKFLTAELECRSGEVGRHGAAMLDKPIPINYSDRISEEVSKYVSTPDGTFHSPASENHVWLSVQTIINCPDKSKQEGAEIFLAQKIEGTWKQSIVGKRNWDDSPRMTFMLNGEPYAVSYFSVYSRGGETWLQNFKVCD